MEIAPDFLAFSREVLSTEKIREADEIARNLASSKKKKEQAIMKLRRLIGMKPKRPMFYINIDLKGLPYQTRHLMRELGDYIDHLIKFLSWEKLNDEKKMKTSLGGNLRSLNGILSEDLRSLLIRYDDLAYVPAKHDFNVPKRRHRFTSREVVHTLFITLQLGKEIIRLSEKARAYSEEKTNDLWGSSNKQT